MQSSPYHLLSALNRKEKRMGEQKVRKNYEELVGELTKVQTQREFKLAPVPYLMQRCITLTILLQNV